jgi:hypothetical protein
MMVTLGLQDSAAFQAFVYHHKEPKLNFRSLCHRCERSNQAIAELSSWSVCNRNCLQTQIEKSLQEFKIEKMKLDMELEQMRLDHAFRLHQLELQVLGCLPLASLRASLHTIVVLPFLKSMYVITCVG